MEILGRTRAGARSRRDSVARAATVLLSALAACTTPVVGPHGSAAGLDVPGDTVLPTLVTDGNVIARGTAAVAVNDFGALTYAVPLWVPPGRNGVQPVLSIVYDSSAGDGQEGVGWSLHGVSKITRCKRDLFRDGKLGAVTFTAADALCLDGDRLVPVDDVGGKDGSEYRTEHDRFSRIVLRGVDELGPISFEERRKDGRIVHYGTDVSARRRGSGPSAP